MESAYSGGNYTEIINSILCIQLLNRLKLKNIRYILNQCRNCTKEKWTVNTMELSPGLYRFLVRPKWFTKLYINNIMEYNFDFRNKAVLDFGCGTGAVSYMFSPEDYMGVDCSYRRVAYAKRLHPDYKFGVFQGDRLPANDSSMDYVIIISVLHHISSQDLLHCLYEFRRVLKPEGSILAMEPCFFKDSHISNYFMSVFDKGKYIRNEDEYLNIFKKCNYETKVLRRFNELFFYNKLFFEAIPR